MRGGDRSPRGYLSRNFVTFPHIEPPDLPGRQRQQIHRIRDLDTDGYDGEVGGRILSQNR